MPNKLFTSVIESIYYNPIRVANGAIIVFSIVLFYVLSQFSIKLYDIWHVHGAEKRAASSISLVHADLNTIKQLNLFGQSDINPSQQGRYCSDSVTLPDDLFLQKAPKAKLAARLAGVLYSSDPHQSIAIIEQNGIQTSYFTGSKIEGKQIEIIRIFPDRVIFGENHCYSMLSMQN